MGLYWNPTAQQLSTRKIIYLRQFQVDMLLFNDRLSSEKRVKIIYYVSKNASIFAPNNIVNHDDCQIFQVYNKQLDLELITKTS